MYISYMLGACTMLKILDVSKFICFFNSLKQSHISMYLRRVPDV